MNWSVYMDALCVAFFVASFVVFTIVWTPIVKRVVYLVLS